MCSNLFINKKPRPLVITFEHAFQDQMKFKNEHDEYDLKNTSAKNSVIRKGYSYKNKLKNRRFYNINSKLRFMTIMTKLKKRKIVI